MHNLFIGIIMALRGYWGFLFILVGVLGVFLSLLCYIHLTFPYLCRIEPFCANGITEFFVVGRRAWDEPFSILRQVVISYVSLSRKPQCKFKQNS